MKVYRFPECRLILAADLESWEDIGKALWARHRRNEPDFIASDAEEPPYELIGDLPCVIDRIAFSPDGQHLLIGSTARGRGGGQLDNLEARVRMAGS